MTHRWDECCNRLVDAVEHEDRGVHVSADVVLVYEKGWPIAWQDGPGDFTGPVVVIR